MNGLTMLDCFGPMSLDEVEQPMLDYVGSTTLGDVTLTNKAILDDIKGLHYWSKKCWIMLNQHCRVDSGNVGPTILSDVGPKMLGDVGATMLDDETLALSLVLILNLIVTSVFMKPSLLFILLDFES